MCDVAYDELPREFSAEAQIKAKRQPSLGVDGSALSCTQVVVDPFLASRNEPGGYTQRSEPVWTRKRRLLILSVMKRRPEVVLQTCAAADVRCVGFTCLPKQQG
jgi:hypothetical protein